MSKKPNVTYLNANPVDFERLIVAARSEFELLNLFGRVADFYRMPWFLITRVPGDDDENLMSLGIVSNWPEKLISEYDRLGLFVKSPVFEHLEQTRQPLFVDTHEINKRRDKGKSDAAVFLFDSYNMKYGVHFYVQNTRDEPAIVTFGGPADITEREVFTKLYFYANLVYSRLSVLRTESDAAVFNLRPLELELMQLVSEGISLAEISAQIGLSEVTIETCLENAALKLGCNTNIQAVSKALNLKLIY